MEITTIGLDIAKRVFQAHGVAASGKAVLRRKLGRVEVLGSSRACPRVWSASRRAAQPVTGRERSGRSATRCGSCRGQAAPGAGRCEGGDVMANQSNPGPGRARSETTASKRDKLIGSQAADCIRASGREPHEQDGHMAAPDRSAKRHIALASREPSTQESKPSGASPLVYQAAP